MQKIKKVMRMILSVYAEWNLYSFMQFTKFLFENTQNCFLRDQTDFGRSVEFCSYKDTKKIRDLCLDLDQESVRLVKSTLKRHEYIRSNNILSKKSFSEVELLEQKITHLERYKFTYSKLDVFPCETFLHHNGLKFVPENIVAKIKGTDTIDAGAFHGDSAIIFSRLYEFRKIHSFEPEINNVQFLEKMKRYYQLKNVNIVKKGLSEKDGQCRFTGNGLGANLTKSNKAAGSVNLTTIDNFSRKLKNKIGLIKMDIEGAESLAIKGAQDTIRRDKPVLLISIYHNPKDFFNIKPFLHSINPDYNFLIRKINPFSLTNEIVLIAY